VRWGSLSASHPNNETLLVTHLSTTQAGSEPHGERIVLCCGGQVTLMVVSGEVEAGVAAACAAAGVLVLGAVGYERAEAVAAVAAATLAADARCVDARHVGGVPLRLRLLEGGTDAHSEEAMMAAPHLRMERSSRPRLQHLLCIQVRLRRQSHLSGYRIERELGPNRPDPPYPTPYPTPCVPYAVCLVALMAHSWHLRLGGTRLIAFWGRTG